MAGHEGLPGGARQFLPGKLVEIALAAIESAPEAEWALADREKSGAFHEAIRVLHRAGLDDLAANLILMQIIQASACECSWPAAAAVRAALLTCCDCARAVVAASVPAADPERN